MNPPNKRNVGICRAGSPGSAPRSDAEGVGFAGAMDGPALISGQRRDMLPA